MTFLATFGRILAGVLGVLGGVSGSILPLLNKSQAATYNSVTDKLSTIVNMALQVETSFTAAYGTAKTGPQKLVALAALVGPVMADVDQVRGRPIANEQAWQAAVKGIAGSIADFLNSYEGH